MSQQSQQDVPACGSALFTIAAWYGLLAPIIAPIVWFSIAVATDGRLGVAFMAAFCILVTSFVFGLVGLFGASRSGRRPLFWMAAIGMIESLVLACLSFVFWNMSRTWHG